MPSSAVASRRSIGALVALAAVALLVTLAAFPHGAGATTVTTDAANGAATIDMTLAEVLSGATTITATALATEDTSAFSDPVTA